MRVGASEIDAKWPHSHARLHRTHHHQFETCCAAFSPNGILIQRRTRALGRKHDLLRVNYLKFARWNGAGRLTSGAVRCVEPARRRRQGRERVSQTNHTPRTQTTPPGPVRSGRRSGDVGISRVRARQQPAQLAYHRMRSALNTSTSLDRPALSDDHGRRVYLGMRPRESWKIGRQLGLQTCRRHILSPFGIRRLFGQRQGTGGDKQDIGSGPTIFIHRLDVRPGWQG